MIVESGMEAWISTNGEKSLVDLGYGSFGCSHYRRRCKIRAPCCNEIFDCRHCHNEAKNSLDVDPRLRHDIPRHDIEKVICSLCDTEQDVQQHCIQCGVCMGKYYCSKCKFFDDDVSKKQYHCNECGICRVGGEENFFHCKKCGCCYSKLMENSHNCVEKAMHHNCPVCFEFLFDTMSDISVLPCGHTIHLECVKEMEQRLQYTCPVCSKSYCDIVERVGKTGSRGMELQPTKCASNENEHSHYLNTFDLNFRLRRRLCLKCTNIRWYGSCAMTVARYQRLIITL